MTNTSGQAPRRGASARATQRTYMRDVACFAGWLGLPPDQATDDLRHYQCLQTPGIT